jgi:hypothetical protein
MSDICTHRARIGEFDLRLKIRKVKLKVSLKNPKNFNLNHVTHTFFLLHLLANLFYSGNKPNSTINLKLRTIHLKFILAVLLIFLPGLILLSGDIELNPGPNITETPLPCYFLNAQSIKKITSKEHKLRELKELITISNPSILGISETWLNKSIQDSDIVNKEEYAIFRKDRIQRKGGGVLLLAKPNLKPEPRVDLQTSNSEHNEILVVTIEPSKGNKIAIITAYRSQKDPHHLFLSNLENTLNNCTRANFSKILLIGDFNYPKIKWNPRQDTKLPHHANEFIHVLSSYGLVQLNTHPSRATSDNILDLVITNFPDKLSKIYANTFTYQSDHYLLHFDLSTTIDTVLSPKRTIYNFKRANFDALKEDIINSNLTELIAQEDNIDSKLSTWYTTLKNLINSHVPRTTIKKEHTPPWIDKEVTKQIRRKDSALRKAKKEDTQTNWARFRRFRNRLKNLITTKHREYLQNICDNITSNPKRFWSYIKSKTKSRGLPTFLYDSARNKIDSFSGMANLFNRYFHSTFTTPNANDPPHTDTLIDPNLASLTITNEEVLKQLHLLNPNKAHGPDDIPTIILKTCAHELSPSITMLFNASLTEGKMPAAWKVANIVPIHKKGTKHEASNYRPISLLPVISKILERCIYNQIIDTLVPKITDTQHGFLKNRSTATQLMQTFSEINNTLDSGGQTDLIYFDLSKAFDSVPHHYLLHKLKSFGINSTLHAWLTSYLTNRLQRVLINGSLSEWLPVTSGVPQGSILGPLLFLLYINDLPNILSENTLCAIFADDTKIYRNITSHQDHLILQRDINNAQKWSEDWGLKFNQNKCTAISLKRNNKPTEFNYGMNNTQLGRTSDAPDLGLRITSNLTWNAHINEITSKGLRRMWFLVRTLGYEAPVKSKLITYITIVRSVLEYNTVIWNPTTIENIVSLEHVQKKCTNFILNNPRWPSLNHINYKDRLIQLNLLPLTFRREYYDLIFFIKSLRGMHAFNILNHVKFHTNIDEARTTRNRTHGLTLITPKHKLQSSAQFYPIRITKLWNSLTLDLRRCLTSDISLPQIKTILNKHYLDLLSNSFEPENPCTYVSVCQCGRCRP